MTNIKRIETMSKTVRKYVSKKAKILELGSGMNPIDIPDCRVIKLDIVKLPYIDVVWDLEKTPLPFKDNEFDAVFSCSVLEHIRNFIPLIEDIHRILKPKGKLIFYVPHFAGLFAIHFLHFNYFSADSFGLFAPENTDFNFETKARFKILKRKIIFIPLLKLFEILFNSSDSIRKFYEGTILKNLIPPLQLFIAMEVIK